MYLMNLLQRSSQYKASGRHQMRYVVLITDHDQVCTLVSRTARREPVMVYEPPTIVADPFEQNIEHDDIVSQANNKVELRVKRMRLHEELQQLLDNAREQAAQKECSLDKVFLLGNNTQTNWNCYYN